MCSRSRPRLSQVYIRSITWRDKAKDPGTADNRAALRISTHALYNDPGEIDEMFRQVVKAIDRDRLAPGVKGNKPR